MLEERKIYSTRFSKTKGLHGWKISIIFPHFSTSRIYWIFSSKHFSTTNEVHQLYEVNSNTNLIRCVQNYLMHQNSTRERFTEIELYALWLFLTYLVENLKILPSRRTGKELRNQFYNQKFYNCGETKQILRKCKYSLNPENIAARKAMLYENWSKNKKGTILNGSFMRSSLGIYIFYWTNRRGRLRLLFVLMSNTKHWVPYKNQDRYI